MNARNAGQLLGRSSALRVVAPCAVAGFFATPRRTGSRIVNISSSAGKPSSPTAKNVICHGKTSPMMGRSRTGALDTALTTEPPIINARPAPKYRPIEYTLIARASRCGGK